MHLSERDPRAIQHRCGNVFRQYFYNIPKRRNTSRKKRRFCSRHVCSSAIIFLTLITLKLRPTSARTIICGAPLVRLKTTRRAYLRKNFHFKIKRRKKSVIFILHSEMPVVGARNLVWLLDSLLGCACAIFFCV